MNNKSFFDKSWCRFDFDPILADWVRSALPATRDAIETPDNADWLRCGGTWFVGVNALPNDAAGSVSGGPDLAGTAVDFISEGLSLKNFYWDRAQISVCYPGYPRPMENESAAAYRFRRNNDAAHVDGLLPEGELRRRFLREFHGFILGIPMMNPPAGGSPAVVWEGSHELVRQAFSRCFQGVAERDWINVDLTDTYHAVRRKVFQSCKRTEVSAGVGEAYLIHRLAVHGMSRWTATEEPAGEGRTICYFRPEIGGPQTWLRSP